MLNEDYREILQIFIKNNVNFLVIGAYAMGVYGYPRATGDFDIWVDPSSDNSEKVFSSLKEFGAPLTDISKDTFEQEGIIFQIGVAPRRIDIITQIDGVSFNEAYNDKQIIEIEDLKLPFLSKKMLIRNKSATGREKDRLDAKYLRKH
ncbi:hypothetical protein ACFL57_01335 [Candidatus Margulisiibacteriota bacterium]